MTTDPYVPGETELVEAFARVGWAESMAKGEAPDMPKHEAEARRAIAKIKADAWGEGKQDTALASFRLMGLMDEDPGADASHLEPVNPYREQEEDDD